MHSASFDDISQIHFVAKSLQNPACVSATSSSWKDLSLARGHSSLILLYSVLAKVFANMHYGEVLYGYVKELIVKVKHSPIENLSLFDGMTGYLYALTEAATYDSQYQPLVRAMHEALIDQLDKLSGWDLTHGAAGVGLYLASCKHPLLENVVQRLIQATQPIVVHKTTVPGWYLSGEQQFLQEDKSTYPEGNFNLGLAHGAPGILFSLTKAMHAGITIPGQKEAMYSIIEWLKARALITGTSLIWPERLSFKTEIGIEVHQGLIRMAWCYGNPGVLRTLYTAGKVLGDHDLQNFALAHFKDIFNQDEALWYLQSPTFCHGFSGLLILTQKMADESQDSFLFAQSEALARKIMNYFDPEHPFGFCDYEPRNAPREKRNFDTIGLSNAGLVDGASGIVLAIVNQILLRRPYGPRYSLLFT